MLGKRARSVLKDRQMGQRAVANPDCELNLNSKSNTLFNLPGLFVGLTPKRLSDSDSANSPTSPLDFKAFSTLTNPNKSPKSPQRKKIWDCDKVGLSIVDSLDDHGKALPGKVLQSSDSKTFIFCPKMRLKNPNYRDTRPVEAAKSLPKNYAFPHTRLKSPLCDTGSDVVFEIGVDPQDTEPFGKTRSCSLNSCTSVNSYSELSKSNPKSNNFLHANQSSLPMSPGSGNGVNGLIGSLPKSEIELSEDYTCVTLHGPNKKTTHIFGDCILECQSNGTMDLHETSQDNQLSSVSKTSETLALYPSDNFLSFCFTCKKILEEGKDIYMYRGEKAFCSSECRSAAIMIDEEMEKTANATAPGDSSE
ncbi:hypothetical protein BT93_C0823 [Corymbia citriodora subsp. variegata]|nr:hypothetical protein BT93_C0823 [Corymbia citriodora subsp. variegata]